MAGTWVREEDPDFATQRILDGAARAFVDLGVSSAGMAEIAKYVGCSRGTLYRYFKNRHELHVAFVNDRALRLAAELQVELQDEADPAERLTKYIVRTLQKVRSSPSMAVWFATTESGMTARMSRGSEVISCLAETFVTRLQREQPGQDWLNGIRARWVVRVIVSLLTTPTENEEEERILIERFVVPGVLVNG